MVTKTNTANINPYEGCVGLVYTRVSSKKQETEGNGLDSQEERCKADLASVGVPYAKTFKDTYTGGGDFWQRPAMRELLEYIDAHPHQKFVVVFDDLKRFARDTEFHIKLRSHFNRKHVILRCLNFKFDDTPEGKFVESVFAAQGQLEREQNKRQVIQKMKARLDAGYWTFGTKKGYDMVKDPLHGKICVANEEGAILAQALEGFAKRTLLRKIDVCHFLVEKGFWKGQSSEKYIDKLTLILKDVFFAGYIEYPRWDVSRRIGKHSGIISLEVFEAIQKVLRKENTLVRIRQDISPDFPIRGLVVCDHCGKHLTAAFSKKTFGYYICHNKSCVQYGKSIPKKEIETKFLELLKRNSLKAEIGALVEVVFNKVWEQEIRNIKAREATRAKEGKELEDKAVQLTNLLIDAKTPQTKSVFEKQLQDVADKLEQIGTESIASIDLSIPYRTALTKATMLLKNPYYVWQTMNVYEQRRLFFFIFEEKLPYNQITGYRTNEISSILRLFEEFSDENSHDVVFVRKS